MSDLYKRIYEIVKSIPYGKVSSYGQIAQRVGNPKISRVVGYAMAGNKDKSVPCHRVIYSNGKLSKSFGLGGADLQKSLLQSEGVEVSDENTVDLKVYLWRD